MMPWKEETLMSLKEDFIQRALLKAEPFSHLCAQYQISRKTGYQLLRRYEVEGIRGLQPRSKRPHAHPKKTCAALEELIVTTRLHKPTWGARKLIAYLTNQGVEGLPAASTVSEILKRHHRITVEESLKRQAFMRFERGQPNELWQMDFKGKFQLLTKQSCYPLTVLDDCSRFALGLQACKNEQSLTVKTQLIKLFQRYGLPDQMNVDNGNPWGNSRLFPYTQLTVWLMQLGIRVTHSRPRHPQTNGKCERFHRTLKTDLIQRQAMKNFSPAQSLFDQWRHEYNDERPHEGIGMVVPSSRYQASKKTMPSKLPSVEYSQEAIVRKVRGNGYISYCNKPYLVGEAFKGFLLEVRIDEIRKRLHLYFGRHKIYTYDV